VIETARRGYKTMDFSFTQIIGKALPDVNEELEKREELTTELPAKNPEFTFCGQFVQPV
jgi:hypothetical protein